MLHCKSLGGLRRGDCKLVELGLKGCDLDLKLGDYGAGSISTDCRVGCWLAKGRGLCSGLRLARHREGFAPIVSTDQAPEATAGSAHVNDDSRV